MVITGVAAPVRAGSRALEFGTPERVEHHLENWRRWHHSGSEVDGFPTETPGTVNWCIKSDTEGQLAHFDLQGAVALETIINEDLHPAETCAVHHRYLEAVYRFPRANYTFLLEQAKIKIGVALSRKCIY